MPDFRAALALAKQNLAVSSGNSGNTGNAPKAARKISSLGEVSPVATAEKLVATVATNLDQPGERSHYVASVSTALIAVATPSQSRISQRNQHSTGCVATVASISTDFKQAEDFSAVPPAWLDGVLSLSLSIEPCPGFRSHAHWLRVYDALHDFLASPHAAEAARLGWTAELLFGVHPVTGLGNVASCGALILADRDAITSVEVGRIRFGKTKFYLPAMPAVAVPVWSFQP